MTILVDTEGKAEVPEATLADMVNESPEEAAVIADALRAFVKYIVKIHPELDYFVGEPDLNDLESSDWTLTQAGGDAFLLFMCGYAIREQEMRIESEAIAEVFSTMLGGSFIDGMVLAE